MKSEIEIDYVICTGRVQRPDSGEHMSDLNYHNRIMVPQPVPSMSQFIDPKLPV